VLSYDSRQLLQPKQNLKAGLLYQEMAGSSEVVQEKFYDHWNTVVRLYTRPQITFPDDRLLALNGVIRHLECLTDDKKLAGLWRQNLKIELLWHRCGEVLPDSDAKLNAPSWSWRGMPVEVGYMKPGSLLGKLKGKHPFIRLCKIIVAQANSRFVSSPESKFSCEGQIELHAFTTRFDPESSNAFFWRQDFSADLGGQLLFYIPLIIDRDGETHGLVVRGSLRKPGSYE
jgi:hypothetical protein